MHKRFFQLLLFLFTSGIVAGPLFAKDTVYLWPTNASRVLNSTFGEYRPGHFHSGIDVKTWEKEGFKVFAVRDGYITRIRVSPFGYGKALYLKLDTGEFAVYGHLSRFARHIERYIKKIQRERQRYSLDLYPKPSQFPVRAGQVIAFTGRTGIGAPHLHFEIRDAQNRPINPLAKYFRFKDTVRPTITGLAVIPFDRFSQVEGESLPKIFNTVRTGRAHFKLNHPIQVWGSLGVAVSAYDRTAPIPNKCAVYHLSLQIDGQLVFSTQYDRFSFDRTRQIVLDRNYRLIAWYGRYFNNLFLLPGNHLPFYTPNETGAGMLETFPSVLSHTQMDFFTGTEGAGKPGFENFWPVFHLLPGKHRLKILVSDFSGNQSILTGILVASERKPTLVAIRRKNQMLVVSSPFSDSLRAEISEDSGKSWHMFSWAGKNQHGAFLFNLPYFEKNRPPLIKIQAVDSLGIPQFPEFYSPFLLSQADPLKQPPISLKKQFLDQYVVFFLTLTAPPTGPLFLRYQAGRHRGKTRFLAVSSTHFQATIPLDSVAEKSAFVFVDFGANQSPHPIDTLHLYKIPLTESHRLKLVDDGTQITFRKHAAYRSFFFRFARLPLSAAPIPVPGDSITYLLRLEPRDIPLNRGAILNFHIPEKETNRQKLAVYSYGKSKWHFQSKYRDPSLYTIKVPLRSFGQFTILRDTIPPEISRVFPRPGKRVYTGQPTIRVYFRDNLSGIGSEDSVRIYLDGHFEISEYDPEMKRVTFQPDRSLRPGKHIVECRISDRCGNMTRKLWYFYVQRGKK